MADAEAVKPAQEAKQCKKPDWAWRGYPAHLRRAEVERLRDRRKAVTGTPDSDLPIGLALSGGGIRSATFNLGFLQALAEAGELKKIDYLSTVSGGSYIGAFLHRMYHRDSGKAEQVEAVLKDTRSAPLRWLREHGRYLAPRGTGDLLTGLGVSVRNWLALHLMLAALLLLFFMALVILPRLEVFSGFQYELPYTFISPWLALPAVFLVLMLLAGSVYFLLSLGGMLKAGRARKTTTLFSGLLFCFVFSLLLSIVDTLGYNVFRFTREGHIVQGLAGLAPVTIAVVAILHRVLAGPVAAIMELRSRYVVLGALWLAVFTLLIAYLTLLSSLAYWICLLPIGQIGPPAGTLALNWYGMGSFAIVFLLLLLFAAADRRLSFLNRTSYAQLYTARLVRAYLGASNQERWGAGKSILDPIPGDDLDWPSAQPEHGVAGPLFFVNATINETVSSKSQTEHRDRKGISIAVGPAGISAGVQHHATLEKVQGDSNRICIKPFWCAKERFEMFAGSESESVQAEALTLGQWVAISGAAVSTGLGSRTSLAFSLLCGFTNMRLGYWWDSGIRPGERAGAQHYGFPRLRAMLTAALPLHSHLFDEFTARFYGPERRHWNLTDGGHFENTGAYELLRRRLPLIIVADCGMDRAGDFADLGNLVRKARIDFNAEIEFMANPADFKLPGTGQAKTKALLSCFGPLNALRAQPLEPCGAPPGMHLAPNANSLGYAGKHFALARVKYHDDPGDTQNDESILIVLKPGLTGDEALDLLQYHRAHPDFPHECTSDQFFDEAQWESYRRLGLHIGRQLLRASNNKLQTLLDLSENKAWRSEQA